MKQIIILFCAVTITTASSKIDLLVGETKTFGPIEAKSLIGTLPPAYPILTSDDQHALMNLQGFAAAARPYVTSGFMKIPPTDPLRVAVIDSVPVTILESLISGNLNVNDLIATGARKYILDENMQIRLADGKLYRLDLNISLPSLIVKADFAVDLLINSFIPVQMAGKFAIQLTNITTKLVIGAKLKKLPRKSKEVVQINALQVYVRAEEVQLMLRLDDPLLQLFEDYVPNNVYLSNLEDEACKIVTRYAIKKINKELSEYPASIFKKLLLA